MHRKPDVRRYTFRWAYVWQDNRIKMSLPLRYGKDRLFIFCTGSSREEMLQAQVERHINHRYSHLSLWRRRLKRL